MKGIQDYHMDDRDWWDIGYNFLIGQDGRIYEGRGFTVQGAHCSGWNTQTLGNNFAKFDNLEICEHSSFFNYLRNCLLN